MVTTDNMKMSILQFFNLTIWSLYGLKVRELGSRYIVLRFEEEANRKLE